MENASRQHIVKKVTSQEEEKSGVLRSFAGGKSLHMSLAESRNIISAEPCVFS